MKKLVLFLHNESIMQFRERLAGNEDVILDHDPCRALVLDEADTSIAETADEQHFLEDQTVAEVFSSLKTVETQGALKAVLVLPGQAALSATVSLPAKQWRKASKALPYLLEDQLATEAEACFVARGAYHDGRLQCLVLEKALVKALHDYVEQKGLVCEGLFSESNLISAKGPSLHVFEDKVLMSLETGEHYCFTLDLLRFYASKLSTRHGLGDLQQALGDTLTSADLQDEELEKPVLPVIIYTRDEGDEKARELERDVLTQLADFAKGTEFNYQPQVTYRVNRAFYIEQGESLLYQRHERKELINIFQEEFKLRRVGRAIQFNLDTKWKPAAFLVLAFLFLSLISIYIDAFRYEKAARAADAEVKTVFNRIFPGTRNYTRMKSRVAALLSGNENLSHESQFLTLMVLFSDSLAMVNTDSKLVQPTRFQYEQGTAILKIDVTASDFSELNQLKEFAVEKQLSIDIASTSRDDSGVKAKLEVKRNE